MSVPSGDTRNDRASDNSDNSDNEVAIATEPLINDELNNNDPPSTNLNEPEHRKSKMRSLSFISTNARSLAPKLQSALDCFEELELDFALVTESWLRDGPQLRADIDDLNDGKNIDMITYNRKTRSKKTAGGGIALLFNKSRICFKEYKVRKGKAEILCATAKIKNTSRKLVVIGVYMKPNLKANLRIEAMSCIKDAIAKCKEEMNDPFVIVTGDINRFSIHEATDDFPDIVPHPTPPTRGNAVLDVVCSNLSNEGTVLGIRNPLETEDGRRSDHSVIYVTSRFPQSDRFVKSTTYSRKRTPKADAQMTEWIRSSSWTFLDTHAGADAKATAFTNEIQKKMGELYPIKSRTVKSTDAPWITPHIKARIRARQRVYTREHRSNDWRIHKKETEGLVKEAKRNFYNKFVKLAKETNNPNLYYRAVGRLKNREAPAPFSPADLFPGESHATAAEKSADFFTRITEGFEPLESEDCRHAHANDASFGVTAEEVEKRLKTCKKPRGLLHRDIWPDILTQHSKELSRPLAAVSYTHLTLPTTPSV